MNQPSEFFVPCELIWCVVGVVFMGFLACVFLWWAFEFYEKHWYNGISSKTHFKIKRLIKDKK